MDSDSENVNNSKIEPTKAEAEAISKGLQVPVCCHLCVILNPH